MSFKQENEITVKLRCSRNEFISLLEKKNFYLCDQYTLRDIYMLPVSFDVSNKTAREILSKSILIRNIINHLSTNISNMLTYKRKEIDTFRKYFKSNYIKLSYF